MTPEELKQHYSNTSTLPEEPFLHYTGWLEHKLIESSEALLLAGKLAMKASLVITSNTITLSDRINAMSNALNEYDNKIISMTNDTTTRS